MVPLLLEAAAGAAVRKSVIGTATLEGVLLLRFLKGLLLLFPGLVRRVSLATRVVL